MEKGRLLEIVLSAVYQQKRHQLWWGMHLSSPQSRPRIREVSNVQDMRLQRLLQCRLNEFVVIHQYQFKMLSISNSPKSINQSVLVRLKREKFMCIKFSIFNCPFLIWLQFDLNCCRFVRNWTIEQLYLASKVISCLCFDNSIIPIHYKNGWNQMHFSCKNLYLLLNLMFNYHFESSFISKWAKL